MTWGQKTGWVGGKRHSHYRDFGHFSSKMSSFGAAMTARVQLKDGSSMNHPPHSVFSVQKSMNL